MDPAAHCEVVLTNREATKVLQELYYYHNKHKWEDVTSSIEEHALGRKLTKAEVKRRVEKTILTITASTGSASKEDQPDQKAGCVYMCLALSMSMESPGLKRTPSRTPHEFKVMRVRECAFSAQMVDIPERAVEYWRQNIIGANWFDDAKEALVILVLNTRRKIIGRNLVTLGNLDSCSVQPCEVVRPAIVAAGSATLLMHNHPSKNSTPSDADIKVTRHLIRAGQLLKIESLDHVIVGETFHSLLQMGSFG